MHKIIGKMRKAFGTNKGTVKNRQKINEPLKLIIGNRMNMNDTPRSNVSLKKNVSFKLNTKPNSINYAQLLEMNAAKNKTEKAKSKSANEYEQLLEMNAAKNKTAKAKSKSANEYEQLQTQIVHQNHPNAALNMELYSNSGKILTGHKNLIEDMKTMGKYNFYKSIILTSTIVSTTAALDFVLGSTIILTPLVAVFSGFMLRLNDYVQGKYLWQTGANSFTEQDVETLLNMLNMYIRILSSPIIKPLFQERSLFEGKFNDYLVLKSIIDGNVDENDASVSDDIRNIYNAIKKFKDRHDKKISVWNVFKIMDYSKKITFVIEQITDLNLIKDKLKFTDLFNLFTSYYNILEMMINIHHTKIDNIDWMLEIEKLEKKIARDKLKIMMDIQYSIKQKKRNPWFRIKKESSYDISRQEIIKLAELI
jgi:hypothetical protein